MSNKTTMKAEEGSPLICIERVFDAPREKAFLAFITKEQIERWWSPGGKTRIDELEPREGGHWRYTALATEGYEVTFFGIFHEIAAPERIVQTAEFAGLPVRGHVVLDRYEFTGLDESHTRMVLTEAFMSVADRDAAVESHMEEGVVQSYHNLDLLLQGMR
jgi:uncharacterized protein YndB with AHSA1/START domain